MFDGTLFDLVFVHGGVRNAESGLHGDFRGQAFDVGFVFEQPGVGRHVGAGTDGARVEHVVEVPDVGVFVADAGEVGSGAFAAPLEGEVVDAFAESRVVSVTKNVGHHGADHLRVAVVAAFADVEVASGEFEGCVEFLQFVLDVFRAVDGDGGEDLDHATGGDGEQGEHGEGHVVLEESLIPEAPGLAAFAEAVHGHPAEPEAADEGGEVGSRGKEEPEGHEEQSEEGEGEGVIDEDVLPLHGVVGGAGGNVNLTGFVVGFSAADGFIEVVAHQREADEVEQAAECPHEHHGADGVEGFHEVGVGEHGAAFGGGVEHEALHDAGDPHGGDVEEDADETDPEVEVGHGDGVEFGVPESRGEPVEHAGGHETVPAEGAGVDVADGPVRIVGEGVDGADGKQGAFEGGHAVEGDGGDEEFDDGIGAQFMPGTAEGEQAVEHAAPAGGPEHEAEEHAERLQPLGKGGVEKVMRACPDVDEDEGPEVDDAQPVGIDRAFCRFGQEIIHDAEDGGGEEEGDGIVAIPPLDKGVLNASEDGIGVGPGGGDLQVVDDVEHRHGDDGGDVEPEGDVEGGFVALFEGPKEVDGEDHPDEGDGDVDGPDEFGVFFAAGVAEGKGDGGGNDDQLPAVEVDFREQIGGSADLAEALGGVVDAGEHHVANESEDGGVGVERPQASEGEPGGVEVQLPVVELGGNEDADDHGNKAPKDGGKHEPADGFVIVFNGDGGSEFIRGCHGGVI